MGFVSAASYTRNRGRLPPEARAVARRERDNIYHSFVGRYFGSHLWAMVSTLGQFWRTPFSSLMTSLVLGVALALPTGLYVLLDNTRQLTGVWDDSAQITVFLDESLQDVERTALIDTISQHEHVSGVTFISKEQALSEFKQMSGLGDAIEVLGENPLPPVLIITPLFQGFTPEVAQSLIAYLKTLPRISAVQMDLQWVKRLNGLLDIGQYGLYLFAAFLGIAILVVVGNTIRLIIQNKRQEIVVTKLIGGTDAFIRRPFLYWGVWFGLGGGAVAWLLVTATVWTLRGPVSQLASLYNAQYLLQYLGLIPGITMLSAGIILGLGGAWLSVGRHLREIEPR